MTEINEMNEILKLCTVVRGLPDDGRTTWRAMMTTALPSFNRGTAIHF